MEKTQEVVDAKIEALEFEPVEESYLAIVSPTVQIS